MKNMRFRKQTEPHKGHVYRVTEPFSEVEHPMKWMLHCEAHDAEHMIAGEDELADKAKWQAVD